MYSIYLHTFPDGKKYVGSTSLDVEKRWQSGRGYKEQKEMFEAIKSVGWDNIQHQVLETVEDKETALKREEYYTLLFKSNEPEFGYNIFVGFIPSEESIKKRSEKLKGIKQSDDSKKKKSESLKEYYKNNEFSEDAKKKISENFRKPVRLKNIKTGEIIEFYSQKKCASFFMTSRCTVCRFINGYFQSSKVFKDYKVLSK